MNEDIPQIGTTIAIIAKEKSEKELNEKLKTITG